MPRERTLDDRLRALERRMGQESTPAVSPSDTQTDHQPSATHPDHTDLEQRMATLEDRLADLQAGLQAVRGYVGNIDHVNQSVERRANAAIAAVERLESAPTTSPPIATATTSAEGESPEQTPSVRDDRTSTTDRQTADTAQMPEEEQSRSVLERVGSVL